MCPAAQVSQIFLQLADLLEHDHRGYGTAAPTMLRVRARCCESAREERGGATLGYFAKNSCGNDLKNR